MALEKNLEKTFVSHGEKRGFLVLKVVCVGRTGFPDRLIIGPGGRVGFCELKQKGKKPEKLQPWWMRTLRKFGFTAEWIDSVNQIDEFYESLD